MRVSFFLCNFAGAKYNHNRILRMNMNRRLYWKTDRQIDFWLRFIASLVGAAGLWLFISIVFAGLFPTILGAWLHSETIFAFIAIYLIADIITFVHEYKWFIRTHPMKRKCFKCGSEQLLTRYREEDYLTQKILTIGLNIPLVSDLSYMRICWYRKTLRPYLELNCTECEEKQVICPYCGKPIDAEQVESNYSHPSKCPHCEKKIWNPLPYKENQDVIILNS